MNYPLSVPALFGTAVTKAGTLPPPEGLIGVSLLAYLAATDSSISQLHYMHGPVQELYETLAQMQEGQTTPAKRWPLVWLVEDITQTRNTPDGFYASLRLRVVIAFPTKATYKSAEREAAVFVPILRPVYWNLLNAISRTGAFNRPLVEQIPHKMTERKRWGNDEKTADALTQFVDAIDIEDLELNVTYEYC